jgi:predicted thioesterase
MFDDVPIGAEAELSLTVKESCTAHRWGSGELRVFATPHMIALMERAAVSAVDPHLPAGYQTVGTRVDIEHLAPSPVGAQVTAHARLTAVDGRKFVFEVQAHDAKGVIGRGVHERFAIQTTPFMDKARARLG